MTDRFDRALSLVLANEGGYANHRDDPGGETYRGITRRDHSGWMGWELIDSLKGGDFPGNCSNANGLQGYVRSLYRREYWRPFLDDLTDDDIAIKLFDMAVNMGWKRATKLTQNAVNYLTKRRSELEVDGGFGGKTVRAVNACDPRDLMLALRGEHYVWYRGLVMSKRTTRFETFARGWLRRVFA